MKGIIKSVRYDAQEKKLLGISLGKKFSIESILNASKTSKTLQQDIKECEKFGRYMSDIYASSCTSVKNKISVKQQKQSNLKLSKFIAESFAMTKGNIRNLYFIACIENLVNGDADILIEMIKTFNPKNEMSTNWLKSIKLPLGAPAFALYSSCVKDFGFRFPIDKTLDVAVNKSLVRTITKEHWIFENCPLGYGSVTMLIAGSNFIGAIDGIR